MDMNAIKAEGRAEGRVEGEAKGEAKGRAEGEAKGRFEGKVYVAKSLRNKHMPLVDIAEVTGLSIDDIKKL
jgi:predicted transposase YdaD